MTFIVSSFNFIYGDIQWGLIRMAKIQCICPDTGYEVKHFYNIFQRENNIHSTYFGSIFSNWILNDSNGHFQLIVYRAQYIYLNTKILAAFSI